MSNEYIQLELSVGGKDLINYINNVPEKVQIEIESRLPSVRRGTKRAIQKVAPVDRGTYQRSFTINNYARKKWEIGYQVYAKPPHYRLSHLLEGRDSKTYGHILKQFRWGVGEPTRNGRIGMVVVGTTKKFPHLETGLDYAEERVTKLYDVALRKSLSKLKRKD